MRVHEVMRCGHVQEWPPARAEGAWPMMGHALELWVCSLKGVPLVLPTSYAKGDERDRLGDRHDDKCRKGTRRMSKVYSLYPRCAPVCTCKKGGGIHPTRFRFLVENCGLDPTPTFLRIR